MGHTRENPKTKDSKVKKGGNASDKSDEVRFHNQ